MPAHKDVSQWHYFIDEIYFSEYGEDNFEPYTVIINVKEKSTAVLNAPSVSTPNYRTTINISRLLDYVNRYFPDVLSEDVLRHYGHNERPSGVLGKAHLFLTTRKPNKNRTGECVKIRLLPIPQVQLLLIVYARTPQKVKKIFKRCAGECPLRVRIPKY